MYYPKDFNELITERIGFCEGFLSRQEKIPASKEKDEAISRFTDGLTEYKELRLLKFKIDSGESGYTGNRKSLLKEFKAKAGRYVWKTIDVLEREPEYTTGVRKNLEDQHFIECLKKIELEIKNYK